MQRIALIIALLILSACAGEKGSRVKMTPQERRAQKIQQAFDGQKPQGSQERSQHQTERSNLTLGQYDGMGFFPLNANGVPESIREAAKSIFVVKVVQGEQGHIVTLDMSGGTEQARANIAHLETDESFDEMDRIIILKQVDACEARKTEKLQKCKVSTVTSKATAFLMGNGRSLWTNAHVVQGYLKAIEKYQGTSQPEQLAKGNPIWIFVFDSSGRLIVNPIEEAVVPTSSPGQSLIADPEPGSEDFYTIDTDYVGLALSRDIGVPLSLAPGRTEIGQPIFVVGYPACTGCSTENVPEENHKEYVTRAPAPDSDGKGLKVTSGVVLDPVKLSVFSKIEKSTLEKVDFSQIIFTSADSQHGNSGSPVLNAAGQVVAIMAGAGVKSKNGSVVEIFSRAVVPPVWR